MRYTTQSGIQILSKEEIVIADMSSSSTPAEVVFCGLNQSTIDAFLACAPEHYAYPRTFPCFVSALKFASRVPHCLIVAEQDVLDPAASVELRLRTSLYPGLHVLAVVRDASEDCLQLWLRHGCSGFLKPDCDGPTFLRAMDRVLAGEVWCPRKVLGNTLRAVSSVVNDSRLTRRELEVLQAIAEGHDNRAIAEELFITRETVRWHLRSAYAKLGIHDRRALSSLVVPRPQAVGQVGD